MAHPFLKNILKIFRSASKLLGVRTDGTSNVCIPYVQLGSPLLGSVKTVLFCCNNYECEEQSKIIYHVVTFCTSKVPCIIRDIS